MKFNTTPNRRQSLQMLLGTAAAFAGAQAAQAADLVGTPAPEFDLTGPAGRLQLAQLQGKLVYLDFWASWCGPCRQSFPWMNDMQARHGARGLQVVGINLDSKAADAERFLVESPAQFTVLFDPKGDTPKRYGVKGMPTSLLIGPDGRVQMLHAGFRAEDRATLEGQITEALARLPKRAA